jgi:hypothetical protein
MKTSIQPSFFIENFEELKRFVESNADDNEKLVHEYLKIVDLSKLLSLLDFIISLLRLRFQCKNLKLEEIACQYWYWHKSNLRKERMAFDVPTSLHCKVSNNFASKRPTGKSNEFKTGEDYEVFFQLSLLPIILKKDNADHRLTKKEFLNNFVAKDLSGDFARQSNALKTDFDTFYDVFFKAKGESNLSIEDSLNKYLIEQPLHFRLNKDMQTIIDGLKVIDVPYYLIQFVNENAEKFENEDDAIETMITDFMRTIIPQITQTMF